MLVGKGGYAILDLKHMGNSGTVSGIFEYAKRLCETGKPVIITNIYSFNRSYPAETGAYNSYSDTVEFIFDFATLKKRILINSNDTYTVENIEMNSITTIPLDLVWSWDDDLKKWTATLSSMSYIVSELVNSNHEVRVLLDLPVDSEATPNTNSLQCLLFNGDGSTVSSFVYTGTGTPLIAEGEYIFRVTVITDPTPIIKVEPFTLSKPS